jgi:hypothetical protein
MNFFRGSQTKRRKAMPKKQKTESELPPETGEPLKPEKVKRMKPAKGKRQKPEKVEKKVNKKKEHKPGKSDEKGAAWHRGDTSIGIDCSRAPGLAEDYCLFIDEIGRLCFSAQGVVSFVSLTPQTDTELEEDSQ